MKKLQPEKLLQKIIYTSLGIFYTSGLVYIFFFARRRWVPLPKRTFNVAPFREKALYLQTYSIYTQQENLEFYKDLVGNILLFIPFPFLLCYVLGIKSYRRLFLVSAGSSFFVEIIQYIFNIGVADIDDLLLNSIGAAIGLLLLHAITSKNTSSMPSVEMAR